MTHSRKPPVRFDDDLDADAADVRFLVPCQRRVRQEDWLRSGGLAAMRKLPNSVFPLAAERSLHPAR